MDYYTQYTLSTPNDCAPDTDAIESTIKGISGYPIKFGGGGERTWYGHQNDMLKLSKIYPDVLFKLEGVGEEFEDIWVKYFKNGKMQVCKAEIVFPPYDESKMQ